LYGFILPTSVRQYFEGVALTVQPWLSVRLNNYFLVVYRHHDNLAAQVIRQRTGKGVYSVSVG
jgi:hypothetical protein